MRAEQDLVQEFLIQRPTMLENNANPDRMAQLLQDEVDELKTELIAGDKNKIAQELPDVLWFVLTIAELHGIDLENAFYAKAIRNEEKYPDSYFCGYLDYEQAHMFCRALWADSGNDDNYTPDSI